MTKAERAHMNKVAERGCALCLHLGYGYSPCDLHHPRTGTGAGRRAPDEDVIGLCPSHHRNGNWALHTMGRKAWERHYGVTELQLLKETKHALAQTLETLYGGVR